MCIIVWALLIRSHTNYLVGICPNTLASIEKQENFQLAKNKHLHTLVININAIVLPNLGVQMPTTHYH